MRSEFFVSHITKNEKENLFAQEKDYRLSLWASCRIFFVRSVFFTLLVLNNKNTKIIEEIKAINEFISFKKRREKCRRAELKTLFPNKRRLLKIELPCRK